MAWAVLISKLAELVGVTLVLMLNKVHPLQLQRENLVSLLLRSRPDAH
jgi:hypothetical protein